MQPSFESILQRLKQVHNLSSELPVREGIVRIHDDLITLDHRLAQVTRRLQRIADRMTPPAQPR